VRRSINATLMYALQGSGSMQGRSQGSTRRNSASSEERQGWGQVMQLSGVGSAGYASPPPEHLSRSNSEGWELLHHDECASCPWMLCQATNMHMWTSGSDLHMPAFTQNCRSLSAADVQPRSEILLSGRAGLLHKVLQQTTVWRCALCRATAP
jgi:hypothetical protein